MLIYTVYEVLSNMHNAFCSSKFCIIVPCRHLHLHSRTRGFRQDALAPPATPVPRLPCPGSAIGLDGCGRKRRWSSYLMCVCISLRFDILHVRVFGVRFFPTCVHMAHLCIRVHVFMCVCFVCVCIYIYIYIYIDIHMYRQIGILVGLATIE